MAAGIWYGIALSITSPPTISDILAHNLFTFVLTVPLYAGSGVQAEGDIGMAVGLAEE